MDANLMLYARKGCEAGLLLLLGMVPTLVVAQALSDPTKPPDEIAAHAGSVAMANELQSVIISPARRAAIIRGQTVELGGKVGDVRLIEVNESGVVLQGARGLEVLSLFPNVKINRKTLALPVKQDANHSARQSGEEERK